MDLREGEGNVVAPVLRTDTRRGCVGKYVQRRASFVTQMTTVSPEGLTREAAASKPADREGRRAVEAFWSRTAESPTSFCRFAP